MASFRWIRGNRGVLLLGYSSKGRPVYANFFPDPASPEHGLFVTNNEREIRLIRSSAPYRRGRITDHRQGSDGASSTTDVRSVAAAFEALPFFPISADHNSDHGLHVEPRMVT